jgi:hypothetical protein
LPLLSGLCTLDPRPAKLPDDCFVGETVSELHTESKELGCGLLNGKLATGSLLAEAIPPGPPNGMPSFVPASILQLRRLKRSLATNACATKLKKGPGPDEKIRGLL